MTLEMGKPRTDDKEKISVDTCFRIVLSGIPKHFHKAKNKNLIAEQLHQAGVTDGHNPLFRRTFKNHVFMLRGADMAGHDDLECTTKFSKAIKTARLF